jgi:hypothetical protein
MIDRSRAETATLSQAEQEVFFVAKHYLRGFNPAHDDLLSGICDGEHDGGIDGVYLFANGRCVRDDTDLKNLGAYVSLDLFFLQVKATTGFGETAIDKLIVNLPDLLSFDRDETGLSVQFNPRILEVTRRFLNAYRQLEMPSLHIYCTFASLRATQLHDNTKLRGDRLTQALNECFRSAKTSVEFLDAVAIADFARARPSTNRELALSENPISTDLTGGYIGVVRLRDYHRFITDAAGNLDAALFEANVRDYEGETAVNRSIQYTLSSEDANEDFWWLNNGVTIVADRVESAGKLLKLESPQIVNGLQTSYEIFKSGLLDDGASADARSVLVKVIQADDDRVKDRIIRATNSQTTLAISSLRATDKVQRQIEEHLHSVGLYYERRKNFYHNQAIPLSKLVSIDQMGQAMLAVLVQLPHIARGSFTQIFDQDVYSRVFSEDHPIGCYSSAVRIHRRCEEYLRNTQKGAVEDYGYFLAMAAGMTLTRKSRPNAADIAGAGESMGNELLRALLPIVRDSFAHVSSHRNELLLERVAKRSETTQAVLERTKRFIESRRG